MPQNLDSFCYARRHDVPIAGDSESAVKRFALGFTGICVKLHTRMEDAIFSTVKKPEMISTFASGKSVERMRSSR